MNKFCKNCGKAISAENSFCPYCGTRVSEKPKTEAPPAPAPAPMPEPKPAPMPEPKPAPISEPKPAPISEPKPAPTPELKPAPCSGPRPSEVKKGKNKKTKQPKDGKKKKRLPGIVRFLIVVACIIGVIALLWYAFGNYFTLKAHSDKFMRSVNSGNLDFSEFQTTTYDELPEYAKEMLGETDKDRAPGPILNAMSEYITVERVKINGFFGGKTVEYRIKAKDLGSWLLAQNYGTIASGEQLQQMMLEQLPTLGFTEFTVTVEHTRRGVLGWSGEYETAQIADALSGGLNTAYNTLYSRLFEELEGLAK